MHAYIFKNIILGEIKKAMKNLNQTALKATEYSPLS